MKHLIWISLFCSFLSFGQEGQILNGGFEQWNDIDSTVELNHWFYRRILGTDLVSRITPAPHGTYATRLETIERNGDTLTSYLSFAKNSSLQYAYYPEYIDSLVFWARWDFQPGDTGMVNIVQLIDGNPQPVGHNYKITGSEDQWTRLAFNCISPAQDSIRVLIHTASWGTDDIDTPGSYIEIDNIHFVNYNSTPEPLPNFTFEDWYVNKFSNPEGFYSTNGVLNGAGRVPNVTPSTDAYAGQYAAKLEVDTIGGVRGILTNAYYENWDLEPGTPYTAMPDSFSGYYKADVVNNDSAYFQLYFSRNDTTIFYYSKYIDSTVDWTPINLSFNFTMPPDSMRIFCRSSKQIGSAVYFDDFQFHGGDLSVLQQESSIGFYPNPVHDFGFISASIPMNRVQIFDLQGKLVREQELDTTEEVVSWEGLPAGKYYLIVHTSDGQTSRLIQKD